MAFRFSKSRHCGGCGHLGSSTVVFGPTVATAAARRQVRGGRLRQSVDLLGRLDLDAEAVEEVDQTRPPHAWGLDGRAGRSRW